MAGLRRGGTSGLAALAAAAVVGMLGVSAESARAGSADNCKKPRSWVAGSTSLCRGTIVYGDYVGDDYGADTGQFNTTRFGMLSPTAGDQTYPAGAEGTADLVRLKIRHTRTGRLTFHALLSGLQTPTQTKLAVAIDLDNDRSTGGGQWGALPISSDGWERLKVFDRGNPARNVIRGQIRAPHTRIIRVQAVTVNAATNQVMNIAFRRRERAAYGENAGNATSDPAAGAWFDDLQAIALASGDISRFSHRLHLPRMRHRRTRPALLRPGFQERVYRSDYTIGPGEGTSYDGVPGRGDGGGDVTIGLEQAFNFPGRYQPYGIYVPDQPGPHGIQMVFHGSAANLASLVGQPGMEQRFGEDLNRIIVTPEARGTEGWGSDISERDILDVIKDVKRTYPIDRDRVFAGGYSQGGYITYRTAALHPDMFAGAVDWVGFTGNASNGAPPGYPGPSYTAGAVGNAIDLIPNLLNIPTVMLYSEADELVHYFTATAMRDAFAATDNVFTFYDHPTAEHLTFALLDDWRKEAAYSADLVRDRNPARVVFTTARFLDAPRYGIRHDHAYWISKIRLSGGRHAYGTIDLTNEGCGASLVDLANSSGSGTDPVPWTSTVQSAAGRTPTSGDAVLRGSLEAVSALRIAAPRTCLEGRPISYSISSTAAARIAISDGRVIRLHPGANSGLLAP